MGGGLIQLVAYGSQDVYLSGNPQVSFFRSNYRRHTNFSAQSSKCQFSGAPAFGSKVNFTVPRNGDLVHRVYVCVTLSGARSDLPAETKWAWVRSLGHQVIASAELKIGGQRIDLHTGESMHLWNQLTCPGGHEDAYDRLTGNVPENTVLASRHDEVTLYVPLQFFFCRRSTQALPLIALQYHQVEIDVTFAPVEDLVNVSFGSVLDLGIVMKDAYVHAEMIFLDTEERRRFAQKAHEMLIETLQIPTHHAVQHEVTNVALTLNHPVKELIWGVRLGRHVARDTKYLWYHPTDMAAARLIATKRFALTLAKYVESSEKVEVDTVTGLLKPAASGLPSGLLQKFQGVKAASVVGGEATIDPVLDNIIVLGELLSEEEVSTPVDVLLSGFQSSRPASGLGSPAYDATVRMPDNYGTLMSRKASTLRTAKISLNGHDRMAEVSATYFDTIQPMQHHTRVPKDAGINVYSFALHPEELQPSGSLNMSRVDNAVLTVNTTKNRDHGSLLTLVGSNYNVLRLLSGMAGLAFSN